MAATVTTLLDIGLLNQITDLVLAEKGAVDQYFDEEPIAKRLMESVIEKEGPGIRQPINLDRGTTFGYPTGGEYTLAQTDPTQLLQFTWKHQASSMVIPKTTFDFARNNPNMLEDLIKVQRDTAYKSLLHDMAQQFRGIAVPSISSASQFQSFNTICASTGTYGGLSRTTYPILSGYTLDMSAAPYSASTTTILIAGNLLVTILRKAFTYVSRPGETEVTNVIFMPQNMWLTACCIADQAFSPFKASESREWGGQSFKIDGIECVLDNEMAEGTIEVCNFNYLDLVTHPLYNFKFTGWYDDGKSDNITALLKLSGEIVSLKPKRQAIITGCPTTWSNPS